MYSSCSSLISKNYVETIFNESTVAIYKGFKCMAQPQGSAASADVLLCSGMSYLLFKTIKALENS